MILPDAQPDRAVLDVRNLTLDLPSVTGSGSPTRILDGLNLSLHAGEATGLVGASGSGKTLTARAILGLLPEGAELGGEIHFESQGDILRSSDDDRRRLRGAGMAMIFQEPLTSFNPLLRIGYQIAEGVRAVSRDGRGGDSPRRPGRREARRRGLELLAKVAVDDPESIWQAYPHQVSGGQRQRAMIAMALIGGPRVLLADEPTTALDVTVQARVLELLRKLCRELDLALLLVTHDLAVVAQVCRRVVVLHEGSEVESGLVRDVFRQPSHPATRQLLDAAGRRSVEGHNEGDPPGVATPLPSEPT